MFTRSIGGLFHLYIVFGTMLYIMYYVLFSRYVIDISIIY